MVAGFIINALVAVFTIGNLPKIGPLVAGFAIGTLLMVIGLIFYSWKPAGYAEVNRLIAEMPVECKVVLRFIMKRGPIEVVDIPGVPVQKTRDCLYQCEANGFLKRIDAAEGQYPKIVHEINPEYKAALRQLL
jgi:hypothetical protein